MATQRINFGEWLPDQAGIVGSLTDAKNVVSQAVGYGPLPSAALFSQAAAENLNALIAGKSPTDGSTKLFASGNSKIYSVSSVGTLTDVSKSGGYTTTSDNRFRFTVYGNNVIGTNFSNKLQSFVMGTSTLFGDLSASAPIAKYITVVRDFVVCAYTNESSVNYPYRVRWSALANETDWTEDVNTQADYQDIPDGGHITGIRGGEFGLVFLEKSIHRMTYVGTPFIFQFDNISRGKGCIAGGSIAQVMGLSFFLAEDGFYMCDGQTIKAIGDEKVDRYFFTDADETDFANMSAAADSIRKLVMWNYKATDATRKLIIYNYATGKWTYGEAGSDFISDASTASVSLESLDSISASIDALPVSLDSVLYIGGKYFLGGTLATRVITYNGSSLTGLIATGDIDTGMNSMVNLARPQVDSGSATVAVASRTRLDETVTYSTALAATTENRVPLRSRGRYHRFQVVPTGANWKTAVGIDVDIVGGGSR